MRKSSNMVLHVCGVPARSAQSIWIQIIEIETRMDCSFFLTDLSLFLISWCMYIVRQRQIGMHCNKSE